MAEMPKSIRVGYRTYMVENWPVREANANGRFAECDRLNFVMRVREDVNDMLRAECLLHEVLHAAYEQGCIEKGDEEERIVSTIGNQLTQIWRDNPEFVAFMSASLT